MGRKSIPLADRFWPKVKRGAADECWNWQAARCGLRGEYGQTYYEGRKIVAHRAAWMLAHGTLPAPEIEVCHTCDNGLCCNPAHLWLGTHLENMQDKQIKGRSNTRRGSGTKQAKLTERDVLEIKTLLVQGLSQRAIAIQFNVKQPTISYIKNGKYWQHVREAA